MSDETTSQARFGRVRSILQEGHRVDARWREELFAILELEHATDPIGYRQQWVPYLEGFLELWTTPLCTIRSAEELEHVTSIAPFAHVEARFDIFSRSQIIEVLTGGHARHIDTFHYYGAHPNARQSPLDLTPDPPHTREIIEALTGLAMMPALNSLTLAAMLLGDGSCEILARTAHLEGIKHLEMRHNLIGNRGTRALARSAILREVESLDLCGNPLAHKGLAGIGQSEHTRNLQELDVSATQLDPRCARALANATSFHALRRLDMSHTRAGDESAVAIADAEWTESLRTLSLRNCGLTSDGAIALANSPRLATLEVLDLSHNAISDQGAIALASSPYLSNLSSLAMTGNRVSTRGIDALLSSAHLSEHARDRLGQMFDANSSRTDDGERLLREGRFEEAVEHYRSLAARVGNAAWMRRDDQLRMGNAYQATASYALYGVPPGGQRPPGSPPEENMNETLRWLDMDAERIERGQLSEHVWRNVYTRSMVAGWRREHDIALELSQTIIAYSRSAHALSQAASCANNCGELALAERYARDAVRLDRRYWHPHLVLAEVALKRDDLREVIYDHLSRVATLWPEGRQEIYTSPELAALRGEQTFESMFGS